MNRCITIRQRITLEQWTREARENYGVDIQDRRQFAVMFHPETRAGRGNDLDIHFVNADHFVSGHLDPYGHGAYAVGEVVFLHNGDDEGCPCSPCTAFRTFDDNEL